MQRSSSQAKRVAITGAASGLGKALALHFAREGWQLALVDIHAERGAEVLALVQQEGATAFFLQADVRRSKSFEQLRDQLLERWGGLDMLINNAGVAAHGTLEVTPLADWDWILDINLMSIVRSLKVFIPLFKQQGFGHFVNIASMAGLLHGVEMGSYSVSKAGVLALSETLRFELKPYNIKVAVVCPGFFQTNLGESLRSPDPLAMRRVERLLASSKLDAKQIAAITYKAVMAGKFIILPHHNYKPLWYLKRYLPGAYFAFMEIMGQKLMDRRTKVKKA